LTKNKINELKKMDEEVHFYPYEAKKKDAKVSGGTSS